MPQKAKKSIARATGSVAISTLCSRVFGLVRDIVIASSFGAGFHTDAFFVAFKVPNLLRRLVAEGALASAFVPVFTDDYKESKEQAQKSLSATLAFTILLTSVLFIAGIFFAGPLTSLFAPGFKVYPGKYTLAKDLMQVMFPYITLVSVLALVSGVLNVLGYFALPAFAPAILNLVLIASVLLFGSYGVFSLAGGVLVGGVIALLPLLVLLLKLGFSLKLSSPFKSKSVKTLSRLMLPAILSSSVYQLMVFINTLLASLLTEGSVSWLYYADRLFQFPLGIFSLALATALLPALSRAASDGDNEKVNSALLNSLRWATLFSLPACLGLILLSKELVTVIYLRGSFDIVSAEQTSLALIAYAIGLWPISCQTLVVRAFLAKKNTKIPALVSLLTIAVNVILALSLMGRVDPIDDSIISSMVTTLHQLIPVFSFAHCGVAVAGSISSLFSLLLLVALLKKIDVEIDLKSIISIFLITLLACIPMSLVVLALGAYFNGTIHIALSIVSAVFVYGGSLYFLKNEEIRQLLSYISSKLRPVS